MATRIRELGLSECPVCHTGAILVARHPALIPIGGLYQDTADPRHDPDANVVFAVRLTCDVCGYMLLFDSKSSTRAVRRHCSWDPKSSRLSGKPSRGRPTRAKPVEYRPGPASRLRRYRLLRNSERESVAQPLEHCGPQTAGAVVGVIANGATSEVRNRARFRARGCPRNDRPSPTCASGRTGDRTGRS